MRAKSSATFQAVAALFAYGLAEVAGRGDTRRIRISESMARLFKNLPLPPEDGRPKDAVCVAELRGEHGFAEKIAARFLKVFDETFCYISQGWLPVAADDGPGPQPNELTVVLRGCRDLLPEIWTADCWKILI